MTTHDQVVDRWLQKAMGKTDKSNYSRTRNIFAGRGPRRDADKIYSYGYHFEMGRVLRDKKGQPRLILLNGDNYSMTTSRHQSTVRAWVNRCGLPSVIIPYSALDAAGVDKDSVELIDRSEDRMEETHHSSPAVPPGSQWTTRPVMGYVDLTPEEITERLLKKNQEGRQHVIDRLVVAEREGPDSYWAKYPPQPWQDLTELESYELRGHYREIGTETFLHLHRRTWDRVEIEDNEDGTKTYKWVTRRHWLGESVIRATVSVPGGKNRRRFFISGFDHQEPRPLYFFCELPRAAKPATLDDAYQALKPQAVVMAEAMGRPVQRQGDIFAINLRSANKRQLRKRGARFEKRGTLLATNHEATEVAYLPDGTTLARGVLYHNPQWRAADHRRVRLHDGWSVVIKNTVPTTK